jgi:hypothetical protein
MIFLLLMLLLWGCRDEHRSGSSENVPVSDTETASTALTIRWHDTPDPQDSALMRAAALDCQAGGIENVICTVYDASGNRLASGDPWPCTAHSGRLEGIPVGPDRTFVVLAEDADGNVRYQGETSGISINAGEITQGVVVDTYRFIPTVTAPGNGAKVDPHTFSLEWEAVQNADQYLVQVAEDIDFQTMVIDETTPAISYTLATLAASTQYFWRVSAVDLHTNIGTASEVRSFTTSDCIYTISPESRPFSVSGGSGSISVSADSGCPWSASKDADWIQITSGTGGNGNGTLSYTVSANTGAARSARITIAGQTHTVNQDSDAATTTVQENRTGFCNVEGTIDNNNAGFTGDGFANTDNATGNGIDWKIDVSSSGTYTFTWRYANGSGDRPADLFINGLTAVSDITFAGTGSWTSWTTISVDTRLSTGIQNVRLEATSSEGLANIDYIEISSEGVTAAGCTATTTATNTITTAPSARDDSHH